MSAKPELHARGIVIDSTEKPGRRLCDQFALMACTGKVDLSRLARPVTEKNRQVAAALLTGLAAGANSYSASRAGYGSYTTPSGRTGTFYSLTAAVIAQGNAAAQNDAMVAATVESGQRNMALLEQAVIKDNTLLPGEWYGGQLHVAPPTDQGGAQKSYTIVITVGSDRHVIDIAQSPAGA